MSERRYDVGPGFVRARECPDCGHTRCVEDCVCNCDAAHAEYEAAHLRAEVERLRAAGDKLALDVAYYGGLGMEHNNCNACDELIDADHPHRPGCSLIAWYALRGGSPEEAVRTYLATRDDGPRVPRGER